MKNPGLLLILLLVLPFPLVSKEEPDFPRIVRLDMGDAIFRQYLEDVTNARRRLFLNEHGPGEPGNWDADIAAGLIVYAYTPSGELDLFSLAARCNIPYAALVTLNHIPHPVSLENTGTLLLPSVPGIFIPENPRNDFEQLLGSARAGGTILTVQHGGVQEQFRFLPGADLSPTERAFFLTPGFRFPLKTYRLTSSFGPRINPVTGNMRVHQGVDLAAPLGTEVFAVRDGMVTELGEDAIYGKYIILQHGDNWASLYGHLSSIDTRLRSNVQSGTIIGKVGSTGQSTGPHLHFELRQYGKAQDPGKYLFREGSR